MVPAEYEQESARQSDEGDDMLAERTNRGADRGAAIVLRSERSIRI